MAAGKVVVYADGKLTKTGSEEDATIDGNLIISGNLSVTGTSTTVNVEDLNVENGEITLNYAAGDSSASANGAGIRIQDAVDASTDATILWDATNDVFDFSHGINLASGQIYKINGSQIASSDLSDVTNFASSLLDDVDAATARSTLGVDAAGTDNSTDVTLAGSYDYLTLSGQAITLGQIDLTTDVTGVLPNANVAQDLTISGGTVDNSVIGGNTAAAGTFTALTANDSLTVNAGVSIVGDTQNEITLSVKAANSQAVPIFKLLKSDNTDALIVNQNGGLLLGTSPTSVSAILDEDNMASDSATALATQQSIKAYVDSKVSGSSSFSLGLNADASGVSVGDVVIIDGSGNVTAASDNSTSYILGVVAANAASGNPVSVYREGTVFDTGGSFAGTTPAVGDPLFLYTDGQTFTVDAPTSGEVLRVGTVLTTGGKMLLKVQHIMTN